MCYYFLYFLFVGLPKTVELRHSVRGEDLPVDSSASGQLGVAAGEKKKKRQALGTPSSENRKPKKRLVRKLKESSRS